MNTEILFKSLQKYDLEHSRNVDDEQTKVAEAKVISENERIDMLKRQLEEMTLERDGMKEQVANLNERLALSVDENQHLCQKNRSSVQNAARLPTNMG